MGHQNHKQKIQHLERMREENNALKAQVSNLKSEQLRRVGQYSNKANGGGDSTNGGRGSGAKEAQTEEAAVAAVREAELVTAQEKLAALAAERAQFVEAARLAVGALPLPSASPTRSAASATRTSRHSPCGYHLAVASVPEWTRARPDSEAND